MLKYLRVAWVLSIILHHVWLALGTRFSRLYIKYLYTKYINTSATPSSDRTNTRMPQVKSHAKSFRTSIGDRSLSFFLSLSLRPIWCPRIFSVFSFRMYFALLSVRLCASVRYRQHTIDFSHQTPTNSSLSINDFYFIFCPSPVAN